METPKTLWDARDILYRKEYGDGMEAVVSPRMFNTQIVTGKIGSPFTDDA